MPIYAYRCEACGHSQDILQKISDPPLTDCPACGQPALRKQVTAAGFQLKGSGWYVTDFRGGSTAAAKESGPDGGKDAAVASKPADGQDAGAPKTGAAAPAAPAAAPGGPSSPSP